MMQFVFEDEELFDLLVAITSTKMMVEDGSSARAHDYIFRNISDEGKIDVKERKRFQKKLTTVFNKFKKEMVKAKFILTTTK